MNARHPGPLLPLLLLVSACQTAPPIAFATQRFGAGSDLASLDPATGVVTRLTATLDDDDWPRWSPDGGHLAFVRSLDGRRDVWLLSADGGDARPLTFDGTSSDPAWSPDGGTLCFRRQRGARGEIWLLDIASGATRRLAAPEGDAYGPEWSPDGERIAFAFYGRTQHLAVVPVRGGRPQVLVDGPGEDSMPRWSPDGSRLCFVAHPRGAAELYVARGDGSAPRRITFASEGAPAAITVAPAWSPDGSRLVCTSWRSGDPELWLVDAEDGAATRLTDSPGRDDRADWARR